MSTSLEGKFKTILASSITPVLSNAVFKKTGRTFRRELEQLTWIIEFQVRNRTNPDLLDFTINGGIFVPNVVSTYTPRAEPKRPTESDCTLTFRIGMLREDRLDKWWAIDKETSTEQMSAIGTEVRSRIEDEMLPFLAKFENPGDVVAALTSSSQIGHDVFLNPPNLQRRLAYAAVIEFNHSNISAAKKWLKRAREEHSRSDELFLISRLEENFWPT